MRSVVGIGARPPLIWFLANGGGAVVMWALLLAGWALPTAFLGESIFETSIAATLIMALALVVGGMFAYSYGTSFGAELANLTVYCLAAALIVTLIRGDVFGEAGAVVAGGTMLVVALALVMYAWQSAGDTRRGAGR